MKIKYLVIFLLCFVFLSCSNKNVLEGNWRVIALIKEGQQQKLFDSNIVFSSSNAFYETRGLAGVNLFNVYVKNKGKSIEAFGMTNTGFRGTSDAMEFEDMFFDAFLNSDSYEIEKNILHFYNHEKNLELQLEKSE